MSTYSDVLLLAQRWDKAVDFGSPMTAWTQEMLAQHREKTMSMHPPAPSPPNAVEVADALTS